MTSGGGSQVGTTVAVTLEQCWHRVPGGTARAALELVDALVELGRLPSGEPLSLVGVSAWHRQPPEPTWRPTIPVHQLPLPRTAPIVLTLHDLAFLRDPSHFTGHGLRFFHAALDRARTDADLVLCSSEATR